MRASGARSKQHYLIFDGDCGICMRAARTCEGMDARHLFLIVPSQSLSADKLALIGLDRLTCEGELKVVTNEGRIYGGAFAVNYFLFNQPLWTAFVVIIYLLPILLLFEIILYRVIARNRTAISRWLGLAACDVSRT